MTKKASKIEKSAQLNVDTSDIKIKKSTKNKVKRTIKGTTKKTWLCAFLFLIVGAVIGFLSFHFVCKNDCFEFVGKDELCFTLGETYTDTGVKIISFGKDISSQVKVETNLLCDENGNYYATEIGTYYIKYTSTDIKYGKLWSIQKIRLITFVEQSEGGE